MAPETIVLKIDAQVMMIKNLDETLVNGSMGRVIGFCKETEFQITRTGSWRGEAGGPDDADLEEDDEEGHAQLKSKLKSNPHEEELPVVSFMIPGGGVRDYLVKRETFKTSAPNDEILASRAQVRWSQCAVTSGLIAFCLLRSCHLSWHGRCRSIRVRGRVSDEFANAVISADRQRFR